MIALILALQAALTPIPEPTVAKEAWTAATACAAKYDLARGDLAEVKWFTSPHMLDRDMLIIAQFRSPDTVVLAPEVVDETVIVTHELLHYILMGPPPFHEPHPFVPFAACKLMHWQNDTALPDGTIRMKSGRIIRPRG